MWIRCRQVSKVTSLVINRLTTTILGKYTESGPIEKEEPQDIISIQNIQPPADIPLPGTAQLPPALPQFPVVSEAAAALPGFPLAFPGLIQPNLLAAVLAQQQQAPPTFENLARF